MAENSNVIFAAKVLPLIQNRQAAYQHINKKHKPFVLRDWNLGCCTEKWTPEYLADHVGCEEVKIHVSDDPSLDFLHKNFHYKTLPFNELLKRASEDEHSDHFISKTECYYLRSLGKNIRKDAADIRFQFPTLTEDIKFPDVIPKDQIFSSVFRIASKGVSIWTHYDVMDNMLIQIRGRKQAVLFPPSDAPYLYLNGDKSEVMDIENPDLDKYPKFKNVTTYKFLLEPGDILYIPALWFHNMKYLDFGIAVNVFWKELDSSFYDLKDVYGNKDHLPAQQAFTMVEKALKSLLKLPPEYQNFYHLRLIERIKNIEFS